MLQLFHWGPLLQHQSLEGSASLAMVLLEVLAQGWLKKKLTELPHISYSIINLTDIGYIINLVLQYVTFRQQEKKVKSKTSVTEIIANQYTINVNIVLSIVCFRSIRISRLQLQ